MRGVVLPQLVAAAAAAPCPLPCAKRPYPDNARRLIASAMEGRGMPTSYDDTAAGGGSYWATEAYLEQGAFDEYGRHVEGLDSYLATEERLKIRYGLNIKDGGAWGIALSMWGRRDVAMAYERNVMYTSTTGPAGLRDGNPGGIISTRAVGKGFRYGPASLTGSALRTVTYPGNATHFTQRPTGAPSKEGVHSGPGALFYGTVAPNYQLTDPLTGHYANSWRYPFPNGDDSTKWNVYGIEHWDDWKPLTGENVWAAVLGPLQALAVATNGNLSDTICGSPSVRLPCTWEDYAHVPPPVQLGITILPGLEALQTPLGAILHSPWGANVVPPDPYEGETVWNSDNFIAYAALQMLLDALQKYTGCTSDDSEISYACSATQRLVDGLDRWFSSPRLLSDPAQMPGGKRIVQQGGHINATGYYPAPVFISKQGFAADCQFHGLAVLGAERVDKTFGPGTAYDVWQTTKHYVGYHTADGNLGGVGYTDLLDLNTSTPVASNTIWSAEWTFGAINMAQLLARDYKALGNFRYAASLMRDAQSMYNEVTKLYPLGLRFPDGSYAESNRRSFVPWGSGPWNPIPSLGATAWSVFTDLNFDPFSAGGGHKDALEPPPHLAQQ